jgi:hypothetical protein
LAFPVKLTAGIFRRWPPQTIDRSLQAGKPEQVRKEAEFSVAMQTGCILKKYELSTNAPVGFHRKPAPFRVIPSLLEALVPQNDGQKGLIDLQPLQLAAEYGTLVARSPWLKTDSLLPYSTTFLAKVAGSRKS